MAQARKGALAFAGVVAVVAGLASGKLVDINPLFDKLSDNIRSAADVPNVEPDKVPTQPEPETADAPVATEGAEDAADAAQETSKTEGQTDAELAKAIVPTFDVLRVEKDGSTLIAGRAAPGSSIEIVSGSSIVAKATANEAGEFVAVFPEPLKPGDFRMVLRSTEPDGTVHTSMQTAIVAVPSADDSDTGILALVETPGEPSRLISTPDDKAPALVPVETKPEEVEVAKTTEQAPTAVQLPDMVLLDPQLPGTADQEDAAAAPEKQPEAPTAATKVAIEAVEIDGTKVFVAGAANPGTRLRVYANEILLGDTKADENGRFLVEVNRELAVGDYIIRADAIDPATAKVMTRAAVPFARTEGEKLAAVAVPAPEPAPEAEESAGNVTDAGAAPTGSDPANEQAAAQAPVAEGAPIETTGTLEPTDQSVIIRRGDTLWQISRRVYGRGVKYTTIYLANENQIRDPNRIWPGQVFALPPEAMENAETAHEELRKKF